MQPIVLTVGVDEEWQHHLWRRWRHRAVKGKICASMCRTTSVTEIKLFLLCLPLEMLDHREIICSTAVKNVGLLLHAEIEVTPTKKKSI